MMRARGYSLVELLISGALAALVVAGALQLHLSFSRQSARQQQAAELQQSLRVAMQLVERALRSAGAGLPPSHTLTARAGADCTPTLFSGVQLTSDHELRVVAADDAGEPATFAGASGDELRFLSDGAQRWQTGDLFFVVPDVSAPPTACALACARPYEVTRGFARTPTRSAPGTIGIEHRAGGCYNPSPGDDACLACAAPGAALRHFTGATVYRVIATRLSMRTAPFGTPIDDATYKWTPLADGVEALQLAGILADGRECDDATSCDLSRAVAVRVTLSGRSASPPYLHRTITSTVQLRNSTP